MFSLNLLTYRCLRYLHKQMGHSTLWKISWVLRAIKAISNSILNRSICKTKKKIKFLMAFLGQSALDTVEPEIRAHLGLEYRCFYRETPYQISSILPFLEKPWLHINKSTRILNETAEHCLSRCQAGWWILPKMWQFSVLPQHITG